MSVIDQLPEPHRTVITEVLQEKTPDLLAELRTKVEPTRKDWARVTRTLDDATSEHWLPDRDYELDERGLAIDYAMGAFINAFIHVNDRERQDRDGCR